MRSSFFIALLACMAACSPSQKYETVRVVAPFPMEPIRLYVFPDRDFVITDYGAVADGTTNNTQAIADAIAACGKAGGGRVVVPEGEFFTGPVHFTSNMDLHLAEGAVLKFSDDPADYLPAVMTSWEGLECYNYSPLVYAFGCDNIAITGPGTLQPVMDRWREWFDRPPAHMEALRDLKIMASTDVPVIERQMAVGENNLRPHLIHFNRCHNVRLDGFKIRESPFWTIHLYMCNEGVVRNLDVYARGHNNDGVDFEMSSNFLAEDCIFDQGDDAVVIKSGRNRDAWRLDTPTENIVIRNCTINAGHTLLGIGSELSGGVRNIYMHDCNAPGDVFRLYFIKTNHRRGGFVENIHMERVTAGSMLRAIEIDTDVLYQWRDLVPTFETRITRINGVYMDNVRCGRADAIYEIKGDEREPIRDVEIRNLHIDTVRYFIGETENVIGFVAENVTYGIFEDAWTEDTEDLTAVSKY